MAFENTQQMRVRAIFDFILASFPWARPLKSTLGDLGVPREWQPMARLATLSLTEVLVIQVSHGASLTNPFPTIFRTGYVALMLHLSSKVVLKLSNIFPFIPIDLWNVLIAQAVTIPVQKVVRCGLQTSLEWWFERFLAWAHKMRAPHIPELPDDVPDGLSPPAELMCPICRGLLRNPQVLLGLFFCDSCLAMWVRQNHTHPMTGEQIGQDMIGRSMLMNEALVKYREFTWQELKARGIHPPRGG